MTTHTDLIAEIDAFLARTGMAETTFGRLAVNDGKFVGRIRSGGGLTLATLERVRTFITRASPNAEVAAVTVKTEQAA